MKKNSKKITTDDYWFCKRCKIDNMGDMMCPCPRGSCEAEVEGKITTTIEVMINQKTPKVKEKKINPLGVVEEMRCKTCKADTGHHVVNEKWTCVHCGTPKK